MGPVLIWNSNGIRPTAEGKNKVAYLKRKLKENIVDMTCVVETHLLDNCENDNETSQEHIMRCQSIKDLSSKAYWV